MRQSTAMPRSTARPCRRHGGRGDDENAAAMALGGGWGMRGIWWGERGDGEAGVAVGEGEDSRRPGPYPLVGRRRRGGWTATGVRCPARSEEQEATWEGEWAGLLGWADAHGKATGS